MVRKRKIIAYVTTSADGFIARPDGSVDWLDRPRPKGNYGVGAFYKSIDTVLWGRKTCDMALDFQKKACPGLPSIQESTITSSHAVRCRHQPPWAWSS